MRLYELANNNPASKTAVFTFGRMNPPTVGHEKLINAVLVTAQRNQADHFVFLSQTHKAPKNPLPWKEKTKIFKAMFPKVNLWKDPSIRTPYEALAALGEDYDNVIMVVGSDRAEEFSQGMGKYADEFDIKNFQVVSAGERDPDADGVEGMSASKAREFAAAGDFKNFSRALPASLSDKQKKTVFDLLRQYLA
jgi:hypothetical protein